MGNVKGPYNLEEWKTMKLLKFQSIPRLEKKSAQFGDRYGDRLLTEKSWYKEYLSREAA